MANENNLQPRSPYKGLAPYDVTDKDNFFGRDREKQILLGKIFAYNVTLLFAGTGVGKSSLLRAAIIPALTEEHALDVVYYADWVSEPLEGLKNRIREMLSANAKITGRELRMNNQLPLFLETCTAYASEPLILMLDQFEELFQYHARSGRLIPFVEQVARVVNAPDLPVSVILSMREDFLAELNIFKGRILGLLDNYYRLEHLQIEQAREAIEKPAAKVGFCYEEGLVNQLLCDLAEREQERRPDLGVSGVVDQEQARVIRPPYLQIVCNELWQAEKDNPQKVITTNRYVALGRTKEIVRKHFEQAMSRFSLREQLLASEMFRYLVTERGTKIAYRAEDLASSQLVGTPVSALQPILEYLAGQDVRILRRDQRLDQIWYELYHDALAPIIRDWTKAFQDEENRRIYRQITRRTREWLSSGRDNALLLRGTTLLETKDWQKRNRVETLVPEEQVFLRQSWTKYFRGLWLRRGGVAAITVFAVIAAIAGLYANHLRQEALRLEQAALLQKNKAIEAQQKAEYAEKERTQSLFESYLTHASLLAKGEDYAAAREKLEASRELDEAIPAERRYARNWLAWFTDLMGGTAAKTYRGAEAPLLSVAISPDRRLLAAVGEQGTVALFDVEKGALIKRLQGYQRESIVWAVAFHPQGQWLATAGEDRRIIRWSLPAGDQLDEWNAPGEVRVLAISPNGKYLASDGPDVNITLWDIATKKRLRTLKGHTDKINDLVFNREGTLLASSSADHTAKIWNVATAKPVFTLKAHTESVNGVIFHPTKPILATASADKSIRLWNLKSGESLDVLTGHTNEVNGVVFVQSGDSLVSASRDHTLRVWDTDTGVAMQVLQDHTSVVSGLAVDEANARVFSASFDQTLKCWDLVPETLQRNRQILTLPGPPFSVALAPDGTKVAVGFVDGTVRLYQLPDGSLFPQQPRQEPIQSDNKTIYSIAFSPDGKYLAACHVDVIQLWQVSDGSLQKTFKCPPWISRVAFLPNSEYLACAADEGRIGLFAIAQDWERIYTEAHAGDVLSVNFDARSQYMLSTGEDNETRLWRLNPPNPPTWVTSFPQADHVWWAAFSPDTKRLAAVGRDHLVRIIPIDGSKREQTFAGHEALVLRAAFTPDSRLLATVSIDATVRFWDLFSNTELFTLRTPAHAALPANAAPPQLPASEGVVYDVWDFDFRCTETSIVAGECWIAVPLMSRSKLVLYHFSQLSR